MNKNMEAKSIVVVGSVALDTIEIESGRYIDLIGGAATYATMAAGRFAPVIPVGIIGEDFTAEGIQLFTKYAANLNNLKKSAGKTFRWGGRYHKNGKERDTLFTELGVFEKFDPQLTTESRNAPYVFLANIHPGLQNTVIDQMQGNPVIITDTMNLWINTTREELVNVIGKTTILLVSDSESYLLTGHKDLRPAADFMLGLGPESIVIKRGKLGAVHFSREEAVSIDAYPVETVEDPTGAGDTFGGGLVSALAEGLSLTDGLIRGTALASSCVEGVGTKGLEAVTQLELNSREHQLLKSVKPWKD
jgi:sugar/nucleoside kinase (ribokinase family)